MVPLATILFGSKAAIPRALLVLARKCHKEAKEVVWDKPEKGWIKLNYDGSCKCKTGKASIGGIFRNHDAEFLLGYAESIKQSNSTIAELVALRRGLEITLENDWNHMLLEGDSKIIHNILTRGVVSKSKEVQKHVAHINSMIPEIKDCLHRHVFREGNMAADRFARIGHQLTHPRTWHEPPMQVLPILKDDAAGRTYHRRR